MVKSEKGIGRMSMDFQNHVVLVTGAGSGIGRSIATAFVKAGGRVMANGRHKANIEETAALLRPIAGDRIATYIADVRVKSEIVTMIEETRRVFGPIDILVNNAGISHNMPVIEMSEEEWDAVMETNLRGPFMLCKVVARQMIQRGEGGKIINITSIAYKSARIGGSHYCSSKAALAMFTKVLALELAEHHINVNSVAPGLIDVGRRQTFVWQQYVNAFVKTIPWGRVGSPDEIAHAVLFLASQDAEYITGTILDVGGGAQAGRYFLPRSR